MTHRDALLWLGLSDSAKDTDSIRDAYEDKVFELVNFFMRRAFIPRLAEAKIKRLEDLESVAQALGLSEPKEVLYKMELADLESVATLDALITAFHENESSLKRELASALDARTGKTLYLTWIEIFMTYARRFVALYESAPFFRGADELVKISEEPDSTTLVAEYQAADRNKPMLHRAYSRYKKLVK